MCLIFYDILILHYSFLSSPIINNAHKINISKSPIPKPIKNPIIFPTYLSTFYTIFRLFVSFYSISNDD